MAKRNKFYMVCGPDPQEDGINIVIAKTARDARNLGRACDATDDVDFIDVRAVAIRPGMIFHLHDKEFNEVHVEVGDNGFVYTDHKPQFCGLDNKFIEELKSQERYIEVDKEYE